MGTRTVVAVLMLALAASCLCFAYTVHAILVDTDGVWIRAAYYIGATISMIWVAVMAMFLHGCVKCLRSEARRS